MKLRLYDILTIIGYYEASEEDETTIKFDEWECVEIKTDSYDLEEGWSTETCVLRYIPENTYYSLSNELTFVSMEGYLDDQNPEEFELIEVVPTETTTIIYLPVKHEEDVLEGGLETVRGSNT